MSFRRFAEPQTLDQGITFLYLYKSAKLCSSFWETGTCQIHLINSSHAYYLPSADLVPPQLFFQNRLVQVYFTS